MLNKEDISSTKVFIGEVVLDNGTTLKFNLIQKLTQTISIDCSSRSFDDEALLTTNDLLVLFSKNDEIKLIINKLQALIHNAKMNLGDDGG